MAFSSVVATDDLPAVSAMGNFWQAVAKFSGVCTEVVGAPDVRQVRTRDRDSLKNGTLIGLGIGLGIGTAWCITLSSTPSRADEAPSSSLDRVMGKTTELRQQIKARFFPYAAARGFSLDLRLQPRSAIFRRIAGNRVEMFELQWDKYGSPRFVIRFGACSVDGLDVNGQTTPAEEVLPTWCNDCGSLQPRRGLSTRSWFRQDSNWLQRLVGRPALRDPSDVADELVALFPEIEQYWASGRVGPHLKIWQRDPGSRRTGA